MCMSRKERIENGEDGFPQEPVRKRFLVSDVTPEGLSYIHAQNKRGYAYGQTSCPHGSRTSTDTTTVLRNSSGYQYLVPRLLYQIEGVPKAPFSSRDPISQ